MRSINTIYDLVQNLRGKLCGRFQEDGELKGNMEYVMRTVDEEITVLYRELADNIRIPGSIDPFRVDDR